MQNKPKCYYFYQVLQTVTTGSAAACFHKLYHLKNWLKILHTRLFIQMVRSVHDLQNWAECCQTSNIEVIMYLMFGSLWLRCKITYDLSFYPVNIIITLFLFLSNYAKIETD